MTKNIKTTILNFAISMAVTSMGASFIAVPGVAYAQTPVDHISCTGGENEIRVLVKGVKKAVGLIVADLYPEGEENFLRGTGRISKLTFAAKAPITAFCLQVPQPSKYALAIYHDENANDIFDKKAFGLPAEPFGVSNNPRMMLGPPSNAASLFTVASEGVTVEINLRN